MKLLFIGPTRTGTTYLWSLLFNSRKNNKLAFTLSSKKEHYYFEKCYGRDEFYDSYLSEFNDSENILDFSPTIFHLKDIRQDIIIDDYFDTIFVIVRDPLDLWRSSYKYSSNDPSYSFAEAIRKTLSDGYSYSWLVEALNKNPLLINKIELISFSEVINPKIVASRLSMKLGQKVILNDCCRTQINSSSLIFPKTAVFRFLRGVTPLSWRRSRLFKRLRLVALPLLGKNNKEVSDITDDIKSILLRERAVIERLYKMVDG
jgi:hypothetical protein